jgi:hypothetical protein
MTKNIPGSDGVDICNGTGLSSAKRNDNSVGLDASMASVSQWLAQTRRIAIMGDLS